MAKDFELQSPFATKSSNDATTTAEANEEMATPLSPTELSIFKELVSLAKGSHDAKAAILGMSKMLALWVRAQSLEQ